MKKNLQTPAVLAAIAASFLSGCSSEKITDRTDPSRPGTVQVSEGYDTFGRKWGDTKPEMLTRNEAVLRTFTGTITDIDYADADRELTLKDSQGRIETFVVAKTVPGLNEAKVGDKVSLEYYVGFNAEVRKPTAEEMQNPLVVVETVGRGGAAADPADHIVRRIRAVVTIEGMDRAAQTLTVKGPRGKCYVARVADPSRFDKVQIGDTIVMTFTEAAAVSLKPAGNYTTN
jgi:hypothetical protein